VQTRIYYEEPLHLQPILADHGYRAGQFPQTERACAEVLSLPVHPQLSGDQVGYVIEQLQEAAGTA
jgi:dTDP-4-amino-4,6-dideoxygalactose transaminase